MFAVEADIPNTAPAPAYTVEFASFTAVEEISIEAALIALAVSASLMFTPDVWLMFDVPVAPPTDTPP